MKGTNMHNFRIGVSDCGEVTSVLHSTDNVLQLAEHLCAVAPDLHSAECYIHLDHEGLTHHGGVNEYADPICRIGWAENTEDLKGLFLFMKGEWHYTEDGFDFDPVAEVFPSAA